VIKPGSGLRAEAVNSLERIKVLKDPDPQALLETNRRNQCCGSGSVGSACFLASWIRILLSSNKNLNSYCFVTSFDFLSLKNDVNNVPSKSNKQKN
jgi:hypothetical protein